ncbi:MAG: hypothetical protein KY445_03055, partial [Armatimonadetes bacterium]|nr:hypothetical protein [Armatimonadota bacterium]
GSGEVEKNTPALQSDRAARRELSARRFEAQSAFLAGWNRLFGPVESEARWFYRGQEMQFASSREFSAFLSEIADQTYPQTPILRNELINRQELSSAAAAAAGRRALVEAMLLHPKMASLN